MINKITTELMLLDNFPDAQNYNSWNEYADSVYNFFLKMGVFSQNEIDFKTELNNIIDEMNIDIDKVSNKVDSISPHYEAIDRVSENINEIITASEIIEDVLSNYSNIRKPIITSPANYTTDYLGAVTSTYSTSNSYEGLQTRVIWECALDDNFNDIIDRYEGSDNLTSWIPSIVLPLTQVFIRTKQISDGHRSGYSDTISFTTTNIFVEAPTMTISGNLSSLLLTPTISLSAFIVFNGSDTHISTDYQVVNKATGIVKWESLGNTVDKLSITTGQLDIQTEYIFRVRFNGQTYGSSSWVEIEGTTGNIYVVAPTLTVKGYPSAIDKNPALTTSAFTIYNGSDTHLSTDYQILKNSDGSVVWESLGNTSNKLTINSGDLVKSTEYRFRARHNSTNYGSSAWVEVIGTTKDVFFTTYGVNWNPTTDTYERTGAASAAPLSASYAGAIQTQMKRCVLNADGTVKYFLHPNDSTKKADGSTAIIDGTDGNVMVQIPKFWYKYEFADGKHKWLVSEVEQAGFEVHPAFDREGTIRDFRYYPAYQGFTLSGKLISGSSRVPTANKTRAVFRTEAAANGIGWSQIDWNLLIAVQLLYLTEYADFDTQAMLGQGITSGGAANYTVATGSSNSLGNASSPSTNTNTQFMSYRGIENWYGQIFKFIDGVNIRNREYFVNKKPSTYADDVFTGDYVTTGMTMVGADGYVKNIVQSKNGFISSDAGGTDSTYIPDYQQQKSGNMVLAFGSHAGSGLYAGGFCVMCIFAAANQGEHVGSAVSY